MTAALVTLAVALALTTAAVVAFAVKALSAKSDVIAATDLLHTERAKSGELEHKLSATTTARDVAEAIAADERTKRQTAELNLGVARARVHELLAAYLKDATDDEIRAATAAAFGVPPLSETADGHLLRPGEDA